MPTCRDDYKRRGYGNDGNGLWPLVLNTDIHSHWRESLSKGGNSTAGPGSYRRRADGMDGMRQLNTDVLGFEL